MAETNEPRALSAALSGPAMTTRAGGLAMHVADRHVERWAPEATASKSRPLRNLSFVDRTIAPWIETAQRSASMRLFQQYRSDGMGERQPGDVSWVFPRPWYQDELDWMAAARQAPMQMGTQAPPMLTTRGTYVQPAQQQAPAALPAALYEFIAPSLSIAQPTTEARGIGYGGNEAAYSPLVPLAAVQAAEVMQRAVAPAMASRAQSQPALRNVLSTMLERAALSSTREQMPSRVSMQAPELVTPPSPRPDFAPEQTTANTNAMQLAERYAEQRAQIVEVQRVARVAAEREMAARIEAARAQQATQTTASATQASPTVRDASARAEAELRQGVAASSTSAQPTVEIAHEQQRTADEARARSEAAQADLVAEAKAKQEAEQRRIEERIAQRIAERTGAARLHEQSRAEAIVHARAAAAAQTTTTATTPAAPIAQPRAPQQTAPAEVAAAIASLPPELQAFIGQRPDGPMRAIDELNDALRSVELLSRAAASGTAFEATRGPRLMMPAGLGGLVSAIDRAHAINEQPAALAGQRTPMLSPLRLAQADAAAAMGTTMPMALPPASRAASSALRVPALSYVSGASRSVDAPASAFEAATSSAPAAIGHVAWADRWLARFAGASQQSLDTLSATSGFERATRMQALMSAAPSSVFVSPTFDIERSGDVVRFDAAGHPVVSAPRAAAAMPVVTPTLVPAPVADVPGPRLIERMPEAVRYDDDAETPDEVFAAIAAGVTRARTTQQQTREAPTLTSVPATPPAAFDRYTQADAVAHAAPNAPGAGFAAQLASSPFAPALRHVLPLPSAPSFDVRSLFGGGLATTYLAGLLGASADEIQTRMLPSWAAWTEQPQTVGAEGFEPVTGAATREAPAWDATYVAPDALDAPTADDTIESAPAIVAAQAQLEAATTQLTTLRSQLLSWNVEATSQGPVFTPASEAAPTSIVSRSTTSPINTATARTMLETMSLPMLGDSAAHDDAAFEGSAWTAPGMVADRAHAWSVAQERSSADLSFDFVPPELVLAARVYGLGPAEAAQAARLALAGPGALTAMAGTVDRTFVQAMAMESERRDRAQGAATIATMYPTAAPRAMADASGAATPESIAAATQPELAGSSFSAFSAPTGTAFGVDRKAPRGAFLWPSATVAALGLHAAAPDGQQSMSVAALELLAAQAVAELGTFTALSDNASDTTTVESPSSASPASTTTATPAVRGGAPTAIASTSEPAEADVLASASAMVPAARRARFDALYVALSQSSSSASWSPAARAARALALAGRGEDSPVTARERAAFAWDVLPVVYADAVAMFGADRAAQAFGESVSSTVVASDGTLPTERRSRGAQDRRTIGGREYVAAEDVSIDGRPGLGALSARAGEALGSYVAPSFGVATTASTPASVSSTPSREREVGPLLRAPSATQELVRTGSGRHGGGETEIPAWFEKAARKMLEDRSAPSDGISMAELTLVTAAPASHVAASTRTAPSANPIAAAANSQAQSSQAGAADIDVEKIANDIYRHILVMMDVARARNGEPYL